MFGIGDRVKVKDDAWLNPVWEPHRDKLVGTVAKIRNRWRIEVQLDEAPPICPLGIVNMDPQTLELTS